MEYDLLIENGRILTQDPDHPEANRVGVVGGLVTAIDDGCEGSRARHTVDLDGAVLTPGFNDAHAHSVWFGHTLLEVSLADCASLDDLYARVARGAAEAPGDEWVVCSGFNQMDLGGVYPDADALDRASGGRPVWIKHTSGHSCLVNRAGIRRLGITGRESFDGGSVVVDDRGEPTGLLEETAMALVQDHLLPASREQIVDALEAATRVYASEGLTSVTDAGIGGGWIGHSPQELGAYQDALEQDRLLTRMQPMLVSDVLTAVPGSADRGAFLGLPGGMRSGFGDARLQLGPVKMFLDGSILGNTARMSGGYANCPGNHGYFQGNVDDLRAMALDAARSGWALAMHAVGDEAVALAIEIFEQLERERVVPPLPHRIEHGGVVTPDQLDALARLRVPIVAQPYFMRVYGDGFRDYIGDERAPWSFRMRSQLDRGLPLAGSSDRPVADGAPLRVMQSAVERVTKSGWVYGPEERVTAAQALRAYTEGSAAVTGWAGRKGRVAPGTLADFAVLEDSPVDVEPDQIGAIRVLATVVDGTAVFDEPGLFSGTWT